MYTDRFVSRLTKDTLALILAGGRGERLRDLTKWQAKPAIPFGGSYRIIDFPLSNCVNSGIRQIGVLTQYKAHSLIRHIQKGWGFLRGEFNEFIELLPAQQRIESSWYKGTADAVFQNMDIIRSHEPSYILILAADHVYKMDYAPMIAKHVEDDADLTIACIEIPIETASSFGVMTVDDDNQIIQFSEKPENPKTIPGNGSLALASMGVYVFKTEFLVEQLNIDAKLADASSHDFGLDIIPRLINKCKISAYPFRKGTGQQKAYWRDIGELDAYWQANIELIEVLPDLNLYDKDWPIWTYQQQSPACKFVFDDESRRGMAVDSMISSGSIVSGALVKRSLLFNDVMVESNSQIINSVILHDVKIGRNCRINRTVIDHGVVVPDNMIIGENTEADAEVFYVSPNGVTLVTPEMLGQKLHFDN